MSQYGSGLTKTHAALFFRIDVLYGHNQNPVEWNGHLRRVWSTEMKVAPKYGTILMMSFSYYRTA